MSFSLLWLLRPKQTSFLTLLRGSRCTHAFPVTMHPSLDRASFESYNPWFSGPRHGPIQAK